MLSNMHVCISVLDEYVPSCKVGKSVYCHVLNTPRPAPSKVKEDINFDIS